MVHHGIRRILLGHKLGVAIKTILRRKLRWVGRGSLLMSLSIVGHVIRRILLGQKLGVILMTILRQN
jgi:hypothetical protein